MNAKHKFGLSLRNKRALEIMTAACHQVDITAFANIDKTDRVIAAQLAIAQVGAAIVQELDDIYTLLVTQAYGRSQPVSKQQEVPAHEA